MKCPKCGSTNTRDRKHWNGQDYITWFRCIVCGLKFNEKLPSAMKRAEKLIKANAAIDIADLILKAEGKENN